MVTGGAQHAMWLALASLTRPGDTVLAGRLTYPGLKGLTELLRVRVQGLAMDEEGIRPDALEEAVPHVQPARALLHPDASEPHRRRHVRRPTA